MFNKIRLLYPDEYIESVFAIDYEKLYKMGYRGLIFDIDNTLVHHGDDATKEAEELLSGLSKKGFKLMMLSNNDKERVESFLKNIDSMYIADANKPEPDNYLRAVAMMGLRKEETVFIGDQIFTDILGANRSGIANILVKFIRLDGEKRIGKKRYLEKLILFIRRFSGTVGNRLGNIHI